MFDTKIILFKLASVYSLTSDCGEDVFLESCLCEEAGISHTINSKAEESKRLVKISFHWCLTTTSESSKMGQIRCIMLNVMNPKCF